MKKLFIILVLGFSTLVYANVNAIVSILPQQTFLKAIGGDKVNISLMVKPGNSPHTYEPKPSQMKAISEADVYFAIGIEFENAWLERFQNQNRAMIISDTTKGIVKIDMNYHSCSDAKHNHSHAKDPHIWTSPKNVKIMANNMFAKLVELDKENEQYYKNNLADFLQYVDETDKQIREIVEKDSKFMVFHPAWGYFAKEYGLIQIPIEIEGKNPKPKELKQLIIKAKKENISVIITAPEFSDKIAKQMANELNIPVIKISPLAKNWGENLIKLAKSLKTGQ